MGVLEDIASIINNSKKVPQLPLASSIASVDYRIFYNVTTGRLERILETDTKVNYSVSDVFLGTVTTAGTTTTSTEIVDYINANGFTINDGELKVIKVNVYIDSILYTKLYYYKPNAAGDYGTGDTVIAFTDLFEFEQKVVSSTNDTTTVIALGDIGSSTIEDYINANDSISWDLQADVIYVFTCTISSNPFSYLWVGVQPLYIGLSQNAVTASDFVELSSDVEAPVALNDLTDVEITTPANNNIIAYNSTSGKWENITSINGGSA